jgi:hypothetical protein
MKEGIVRATVWVPIIVLAMAAPSACQEKSPPTKAKSIATDPEVIIGQSETSVVVSPVTAVVALGNPLKFTVRNLPAGATVEVDFVTAPAEAGKDAGKPYVGPFPRKDGDTANPSRGRYVLSPGQSWTTLPADELGYWKYQVIIRFANGTEISVDPGVIIKEGT